VSDAAGEGTRHGMVVQGHAAQRFRDGFQPSRNATGWTEPGDRILAEAAALAKERQPGMEVTTELSVGPPVAALRAHAGRGAPPSLTTTPRRAQRDSPDTNAMGAARMSGQGVATTSTATAGSGSPAYHQASPASTRVTGRNRAA
jgi:hypothetical protein